MKSFWGRYLNELVGLAVMALMTVALVAGQAQANADGLSGAGERQIVEIRLTVSDQAH